MRTGRDRGRRGQHPSAAQGEGCASRLSGRQRQRPAGGHDRHRRFGDRRAGCEGRSTRACARRHRRRSTVGVRLDAPELRPDRSADERERCVPAEPVARPYTMASMQLRELNIGCFGGGTGLPSLLGGLKNNPWLRLNAVVTMFDSGGSSGQLRDELGVLPPGDVLKCALALARNEGEARRVLLSRLPALEQHARLGGHTGGNLLLSMMEQYSGDFLEAVDGLRVLLGCKGKVWPISVEPASVCAEYADGTVTRGEVGVDAAQSLGHQVRRLWLEPPAAMHPGVADAMRAFDAAIIGPGSFFTSILPPLLVR